MSSIEVGSQQPQLFLIIGGRSPIDSVSAHGADSLIEAFKPPGKGQTTNARI